MARSSVKDRSKERETGEEVESNPLQVTEARLLEAEVFHDVVVVYK